MASPSVSQKPIAAGALPDRWQSSDSFQGLQALAYDLLYLWEETGAVEKEWVADVEVISKTASAAIDTCLAAWQSRKSVLNARCEELLAKISDGMESLGEGLFAQEQELAAAVKLPFAQRAVALERLLDDVTAMLGQRDYERACMAAAREALGIDGADGLSAGELEALLRERHAAALRALGLNPDDFPLDGDLAAMAAQLKELEAKLKALKDSALSNARRARAIWEELQESPRRPQDNEAVVLSAEGADSHVTAEVASAVEASRTAWQARHAELAEETNWLHAAIRGHGVAEVAEPFLSAHGGLHAADRAACRAKLQELRDKCRAAEAPVRQNLLNLCKSTGAGVDQLNAVYKEVEEVQTAAERLKLLEKEAKRMERYAESVKVILGQREELKALAVAGECFERAAQAGQGRWVGNSKHFLEEEKFRKRFVKQFPELRDKLIDSISAWETADGRSFVHGGECLGDRLKEMRDQGVSLASAQGDLSVVGVLLQMLGVRDKEIPASPAAKRSPGAKARSRSSSRMEGDPLPPIHRVRSEGGLASCSPSPEKRRGMRRQQSMPSWGCKQNSMGNDGPPKLPPINRGRSPSRK